MYNGKDKNLKFLNDILLSRVAMPSKFNNIFLFEYVGKSVREMIVDYQKRNTNVRTSPQIIIET